MAHAGNNQFQRYNQIFRIILLISFLASLVDCFFPLVFPDAEIEVMTENGFEVIGIAMMSKSHVVLLAMIFSVTPILWMYALWQLFGISKIWQKGEFLTREIGAYFKRFSYVILAIFVVETILHLTVDSLLVSWNYVTAFPEMSLEDILFLVELPFLVACIFLIMGSKAMSEIIVMKEESDLTI